MVIIITHRITWDTHASVGLREGNGFVWVASSIMTLNIVLLLGKAVYVTGCVLSTGTLNLFNWVRTFFRMYHLFVKIDNLQFENCLSNILSSVHIRIRLAQSV